MPDEPIIYLNGEYLPRARATVSVDDRAMSFGDGVYEVTRYVAGRPFEMDAHLSRLRRSLAAIELVEPDEIEQLPGISDELVRRNGLPDATVYWAVTRGPGPRDRMYPVDPRPTVLATYGAVAPLQPDGPVPTRTATVVEDLRWGRCDIKALVLLPTVLARNAAVAAGFDEAIFQRDGTVTEATAANLYIARDGAIHTHPLGRAILGGITRRVVLDLARGLDIPIVEQPFDVDTMLDADEVFLTGTTTHVTGVTRIDDRSFEVGAVTRRLYDALMRTMLDV